MGGRNQLARFQNPKYNIDTNSKKMKKRETIKLEMEGRENIVLAISPISDKLPKRDQ